MYIYLNGNIIREQDASVSINDRGFLLGDGVFESIRAYRGMPFLLNSHLERLIRGAEKLRIKIKEDRETLTAITKKLLELNQLQDAYIRITLSRGTGGRGIDIDGCNSPTLCIITRQYSPPDESLYKNGVSVGFLTRRNSRLPEDSDIKSISFLNYILARNEVRDRGLFEGILLNQNGQLTEGTVSNLFFVKGKKIHTPTLKAGILKGITRQEVIKIAHNIGLQVEEGLYSRDDLLNADEMFLTNSLIEIIPVRKIEGMVSFNKFEISQLLLKEYRKQTDI